MVTKDKRLRDSQNTQAAEIKAMNKKGGTRLVLNKTPELGGTNDRTCLCDAILEILPQNEEKELIRLAFASAIPADGDT